MIVLLSKLVLAHINKSGVLDFVLTMLIRGQTFCQIGPRVLQHLQLKRT